MLEAAHDDAEIARAVGAVRAGVEEAGEAERLCDGAAIRQRAHREPALHALGLVRLRLRVAFAVVDPGVELAVTARQLREVAGAKVRRSRNQPFAFGEHRSLHAIAIDALLE